MAAPLIKKLDRPLLLVVGLLCALGVYNLASAGRSVREDLYLAQAAYAGVGMILLLVVVAIDYRNFEGLAFAAYLAVIGLLVLTLLFGRVVNGSRRWLYFGPIGLQTSDLAKLAVVLVMAKLFHQERREGARLTLTEIFRPMNVSRPLIAALIVLAVTVLGDGIKPAELKQRMGLHTRILGKLKESRPRLTVGKDANNSVQLPFQGLDAHHAELVRVDDGHYILRDLNSAAGTYVNGELASGDRLLKDGDVIRFGLNPRSELSFGASLQRFRKFRTPAAVFALMWLVVAIGLQLKKGSVGARDLVAPIDLLILPAAFVLVQPDLGTAMIIVLTGFTVMLYVGLAPVSLLLLTLMSGGGAFLAWGYLLKPYQKQRVLSFLDPEADLSGAGYHQHQSMIAIGSGGFGGKGHGQGTQTQLSFLPEQQTDFIFSVWAEEQGFVGSAFLAILFLLFVVLAFRLALEAKDHFGALLAIGMTGMIFWHAFINMAMVLRLAPVVGVPLPFFSYGGSFLVTSLVGVGVILNIGARRYVF